MSKKSYCTVADYLRDKHAEFYEVVDQSCAISGLGGSVTVVIPTDEQLKKITALLDDGTPEKVEIARNMILAGVFIGVMKSGKDFAGGVNNRLSPSQHVGAEASSEKKVKLSAGKKTATIELDTDFIDKSRRGAAVWKATSGAIEVTTDAPARQQKRGANGNKTGGYQIADYESQSERWKIGIAVENEASFAVAAKKSPQDVFMRYTLGLAKYVYEKDHDVFFTRVLPNLVRAAADFYVLVEPHNNSGQYLISDVLINGWWESCRDRLDHAEASPAFIDAALTDASKRGHAASIYTNRSGVIGAIAAARTRVLDEFQGWGKLAAERLREFYNRFSAENAIGGLENVFPGELADVYRNSKNRKFVEDDVRFYLDCALHSVASAGKTPPEAVKDLDGVFNTIGDALRDSEPIVATRLLKTMIVPADRIDQVRCFISSSFFLAMPMAAEETSQLSNNQTYVLRPAFEEMFLNAQGREVARHQRLVALNGGTPNEKVLKTLKAMGVELTQDQKKQLQMV